MFSRLNSNTQPRKRQKTSHDTDSSSDMSQHEETGTVMPETAAIDTESTRVDQSKSQVKETHLESMREYLTCGICTNLFTEPRTLACGHTYCYICLYTWIKSPHKHMCPKCRAPIKRSPIMAYTIRDMVEHFTNHQELLADGEQVADYKRDREEAAAEIQKLSDESRSGDILKDVLEQAHSQHGMQAVFDAEDNVLRCPRCHHEVEHGVCSSCEAVMDGASGWSGDDLDWASPSEDFESEDDFDHTDAEFDLDAHGEEAHIVRDVMATTRRHMAAARRHHRRVARELDMSDQSETDDDEDDSEEMQDFIVNDVSGVEHESSDDSDDDSEESLEFQSSSRVASRRAGRQSNPIELESDSDESTDRPSASQRSTNASGRRARVLTSDSEEDPEEYAERSVALAVSSSESETEPTSTQLSEDPGIQTDDNSDVHDDNPVETDYDTATSATPRAESSEYDDDGGSFLPAGFSPLQSDSHDEYGDAEGSSDYY